MAWNHKARLVAMAVALQVSAGTFVQPSTATDLIAVSAPTNTADAQTVADPTATGTIWEQPDIYLGETWTVGATVPLRGPGGVAPPAANAWPVGRVFQAAGWAEIRKGASSNAAVAAATTTSITLANTESAVDDFLIGAPIQHANIGTGFKATTLIRDYNGTTKVADLAETLGVAPPNASQYTIPAYLSYQLGTLNTAPPLLSMSVWRDKKRYDYVDWAPASNAINMPVANDQNQVFPDVTFSGSATLVGEFADTTPALPTALLAVPVAPARNGKFYLDKVKLGHQSLTFTQTSTLGAASNQNQATGQDGNEILSGARATAMDLNAADVATFDLRARVGAQTVLPVMSTWGMGPGNNFGFIQPNVALRPFSPGERNGFVSATGNAVTTDLDKSAVLTIWW